VGGLVIGFVAAGSFYLLARALGTSAMFLSWMALWCGFGLLHGRLVVPLDAPGLSS
jgi:hypothetical protein